LSEGLLSELPEIDVGTFPGNAGLSSQEERTAAQQDRFKNPPYVSSGGVQ
jgi:hypothetical protein